MSAQQGQVRANGSIARRGALASIAALAAGVLAKASDQIAEATDNTALIVGQVNTETGQTELDRSNANVFLTGLVVRNNNGFAIQGLSATGPAVQGDGFGGPGPGIRGLSGDVNPTWGVAGYAGNYSTSTPTVTAGVVGNSDNQVGVYGLSVSNTGVLGQTNTGVGVQGTSNGNVGVLGVSNASVGVYANSLNQYGLYATSPNNYAAIGTSNSGTGVYGTSNGNVGVLGTSNSSIGGFFSSSTSTGLYATGPSSAFAARFDGPVQVNGAFTVLGGPKSAAVPHPDGTYRRLYCVESPESWFEDIGHGQLTGGRASVALDRDFAALVHSGDYEVFLTPKGDSRGLYVTGHTAAGFEVREQQGGTSSIAFGYRVVARR
ncbi:MAG TPA: hypothetical protein VK066_18675 [Chloroflexota bacterium]|nr:hypothetical protein [Chloroflexota bacterium]